MSFHNASVHDAPIRGHEVVHQVAVERPVVGPEATMPVAVRPAKLSWGAILGGLLVALALWVMLGAIGAASGLSQHDPAVFQEGGMRAGLWSVIAPLVALLVGSMVAARSAGIVDRATGAIHGAVLWALVLLSSLIGVGWRTGAVPTSDPTRALDPQAQMLRSLDPTGRSLWWVVLAMALGLVVAVLGSTAGVSRRQRLGTVARVPLVPRTA